MIRTKLFSELSSQPLAFFDYSYSEHRCRDSELLRESFEKNELRYSALKFEEWVVSTRLYLSYHDHLLVKNIPFFQCFVDDQYFGAVDYNEVIKKYELRQIGVMKDYFSEFEIQRNFPAFAILISSYFTIQALNNMDLRILNVLLKNNDRVLAYEASGFYKNEPPKLVHQIIQYLLNIEIQLIDGFEKLETK